jgi:hypothetical protein
MSLVETCRKSGIRIVDMRSFQNGKLTTSKPTILMIFWESCGHCHNAIPGFVRQKNMSKWELAGLEVDDLSDADSKNLGKITKGAYQGSVPLVVMFNGKGEYIGTYDHKVNTGCLKYEYHVLTGEGDATKC